MALILISPPAVEPVTLSELKEFAKVDPTDTSQDNVLTTLAMMARSWCEAYTGRRFVQQTWRLYMDFFPGYIDLKVAGAKVSSPFVSGSNAVLVGIRYAVQLPYPPVQSVAAFVYQNANGQVTSMIIGSTNIAGVTNANGQPIGISTATPHGLQSGASVTIAGNAALLTVLNGQASQVVTVIDPNNLTFGVLGTGSAISATGTVTGYNYVQDLASNPARLTPVFGQMWPVARVVVNAVSVDFVCGYAMPVTVTMNGTDPNAITAIGYSFVASDVGRPISIPGAGLAGATLNTVIASVEGGNAESRDPSSAAVTNATALLINMPSANPAHWEIFKGAIKLRTTQLYENRVLGGSRLSTDDIKDILYLTRAF